MDKVTKNEIISFVNNFESLVDQLSSKAYRELVNEDIKPMMYLYKLIELRDKIKK